MFVSDPGQRYNAQKIPKSNNYLTTVNFLILGYCRTGYAPDWHNNRPLFCMDLFHWRVKMVRNWDQVPIKFQVGYCTFYSSLGGLDIGLTSYTVMSDFIEGRRQSPSWWYRVSECNSIIDTSCQRLERTGGIWLCIPGMTPFSAISPRPTAIPTPWHVS